METLLIIALVVLILFGIIVIGTFTYVNIRGVKYYKEADRMVSENEKPHQQPLDEDEAFRRRNKTQNRYWQSL